MALRFPQSCGEFVIAVRESTEHEHDSWSALTAAGPLELSCVAEPREDVLSEKDLYLVYVSLCVDMFNVHKLRRVSPEGYYGGCISLCLEDGAFSARPPSFSPPGASPQALLRKIIDDLIKKKWVRRAWLSVPLSRRRALSFKYTYVSVSLIFPWPQSSLTRSAPKARSTAQVATLSTKKRSQKGRSGR